MEDYGEKKLNEITAESLTGKSANTVGEFMEHMRASAGMLDLAVKEGVVDQAQLEVFVNDFQNAQNAWEVLQIRTGLTRILYREAIDYSDILYNEGVIDLDNHRLLKSNLSKGSEFTTKDLQDADELDKITKSVGDKIFSKGSPTLDAAEFSGALGEEILRRLAKMDGRRAAFPKKNKIDK